MAADRYWLGVDFGTSTTVAALSGPDRRTRPLLFDASPLLASAVFAGPEASLLTGADAERAALAYPAGLEPNPKQRIDDGTIWLGERAYAVVDVIAAVLERVAREAHRVAGGPPAGVVLTHPAGWSHTRLGVLAAAATRARLGTVGFVAEPVAAAAYYATVLGHKVAARRCLVVYDLGAGTFDVSVVRPAANGFEVLAADGLDDVGGLDLDAAVVSHARGLTVSAATAWQRLDWPQSSADQLARYTLWRGARAAKEQLSRHAAADVHVPLVGADVRLTRDEFEKAARPHLDRTAELTLRVLREAGVPREQIGGVFLVGGSSRIPLASTLLHRTLRIAPIAIDQAELVVAEGSLHTGPAAPPPAPSAARPAAPPAGRPAEPPPVAPTARPAAGPAPAASGPRPHEFAGQWWTDPHDLAAAMAVEWSKARQVFSGLRSAELGYWLSDEVGDRTFPANLVYRRAFTTAEADECVAAFVAHFAPDIRPRFRGEVADAAALATVCERASGGNAAAADLLAGLTEPIMRALARHPCDPRHAGCTGPGCAVLAAAWTNWTEGRSTLDAVVHKALRTARAELPLAAEQQRALRGSVTADADEVATDAAMDTRVSAATLGAVLAPDTADALRLQVESLPPVERPAWWWDLYEQIGTANAPTRAALCVLLLELAEPAAMISAAESAWTTRQEEIRHLRRQRFTAAGIGAVPGLLAPALVAGIVGSGVAGAEVATWLFSIALALVVVGEVLLLIAMTPAGTLDAGAFVVWSGIVVGAVVAAVNPGFLFGHWGWLGYCSCLPVFFAFFGIMTLVDETPAPRDRPPRAADR